MTDIEVTKEIWNQMKTLDFNLCMCMGVKNLRPIDQGLSFDVNGMVFKGRVEIRLTPMDLYKITLIKPTKKRNEEIYKKFHSTRFDVVDVVVKEVDGIFFDDMMPFLAINVEGRP